MVDGESKTGVMDDGVYWIKISYSNCYIIERDKGLDLINAGILKNCGKLLDYIKFELDNKPINRIFITDYRLNHVSGLRTLTEIFPEVKIYASTIDSEYYTGERKMLFPNFNVLLRPLTYFLRFLLKPKSIEKRYLTELPQFEYNELGIETSKIDDIEIIPTPGVSPGSLSFLYKHHLFCGSLFSSDKNRSLKFSPKMFINSRSDLVRSTFIISKFDFNHLFPTYGLPIIEDVKLSLEGIINVIKENGWYSKYDLEVELFKNLNHFDFEVLLEIYRFQAPISLYQLFTYLEDGSILSAVETEDNMLIETSRKKIKASLDHLQSQKYIEINARPSPPYRDGSIDEVRKEKSKSSLLQSINSLEYYLFYVTTKKGKKYVMDRLKIENIVFSDQSNMVKEG